jgi:hypothetical protein
MWKPKALRFQLIGMKKLMIGGLSGRTFEPLPLKMSVMVLTNTEWG